MKLELRGEMEIGAPREKVFNLLVDPRSRLIERSVPDVESYTVTSEDSFEAKVKVGISFVRGTITLRGRVAERRPPVFARLLADGSGLGSSVKVDTSFTLEEREGRTLMRWEAVSELSGLVTGLGERMVRSQADKMVGDIFSRLKESLEREASGRPQAVV